MWHPALSTKGNRFWYRCPYVELVILWMFPSCYFLRSLRSIITWKWEFLRLTQLLEILPSCHNSMDLRHNHFKKLNKVPPWRSRCKWNIHPIAFHKTLISTQPRPKMNLILKYFAHSCTRIQNLQIALHLPNQLCLETLSVSHPLF